MHLSRRSVLKGALAGAAAAALPSRADDLAPVYDEIKRRHDEAVQRIQQWIRTPSIAAENLNAEEGVQLAMQLFKDAGFQQAVRVPTDGKPGIFATLDAGAPKTLGLYFMYDVKQADPKEWSSPPFEGRLVDKPGFGKCIVGRGAVNQKGPEGAFLAALHAVRGAGRKLPVNLVLVAEGEEEIGSPHFPQVVRRPEVSRALSRCSGIFMPSAAQARDGTLQITLGAKGVIECELVASGEKWGRGPDKDVHSSLRSSVDSPAYHLVQALNTLVTPDGTEPAIDGWFDKVKKLSPAEEKMLDAAAARMNEADLKKQYGVTRWVHDLPFRAALERLASWPTVNIEGLVGGYTGQGGKTVLPHRAVAKMDFRLVAAEAEGASREAGVRRPRSQHDRRVRSQHHLAGLSADQGGARHLPEGRVRSHPLAAQRRLVARLLVHRRAAQAGGGPLRPRARQRRARARRVLRHREHRPEVPGPGRRRALVRRLPLRPRLVAMPDRDGSRPRGRAAPAGAGSGGWRPPGR
jgi:acetylornithine deacetylase/succinyl-diaminopimelate desuccinylase-like protein